FVFFFFTNRAPPHIYTLSLHDALPIFLESFHGFYAVVESELPRLVAVTPSLGFPLRARAELLKRDLLALGLSRSDIAGLPRCAEDRKSTRLNSSHDQISYAVFCLKKKK